MRLFAPMTREFPVVFFVDQDAPALNYLLAQIEPIFLSHSLRNVGQIRRYVDQMEPDILVLSDRLEYRKKDIRAILADLRAEYTLPILMLVDSVTEQDRARWREWGATDCILHPTRLTDRIDAVTRKILDVVHPRYSSDPEGMT